MCGRYALWGVDLVGGRFLIVDPTLGFRSHFNIAPQTENPVIVAAPDGNHILMMRWGLVPHWTKDLKTVHKPINARAETLAEKPTFLSLLKQNRCIVPSNGFYEWKKTDGKKEPYFIHLKDKALFGFAALYDTWKNAADLTVITYIIITTEPNELLSSIHNRMPVILRRDHEQQWLSPSYLSIDELKTLLSPYNADEMTAYPVSQRVNAPSSDGEDLIQPNTSARSWFT